MFLKIKKKKIHLISKKEKSNEIIGIDLYESNEEVFNFDVVEEKPIFPGCEEVLKAERYMCFQKGIMNHIRKNFKYPNISRENQVSEKIFVQFVIDKSGKITKAKVVRGEDEHLKAEALRLVNSLPKLQAAKHRGKAVPCSFTVPMNFKLDDSITPKAKINLKVGQKLYGGIIFYLDESGKHGLVAALEDLPGTYKWGCSQEYISGADGTDIVTGYQNTLDIVAGCSTTSIAARKAIAYENGGYSDWYLPSKDELVEMYNTIGNGGAEGNIGGFESDWYSSSSEADKFSAFGVSFNDGNSYYVSKSSPGRVRVIRAF